MHAKKVSHKILNNACPWMHAARRNTLAVTIFAAIDERRLSVTGLGLAIESDAKEKHCIKRADRLIGNEHLYGECQEVYHSFARTVIGSVGRPTLLKTIFCCAPQWPLMGAPEPVRRGAWP